MTGAPFDADTLAAEAMTVLDGGGQIAPFSDRYDGFDMETACAVADRIRALRVARGEVVAGRKIGFTNRRIWPIYNVAAPIWGFMYAGGVTALPEGQPEIALPALPEPRIEPEIAFRLARRPDPAMSDAELLACAEWVAHGIEIVFSPFPGWRFTAADTAAGFGMHAAFLHGPPRPAHAIDPEALVQCRLTLRCDDGTVLEGRGADVLDGPLAALRHLLRELARLPGAPALAPGEIVTTGTLTDAPPLAAGQRWRTELTGLDLPGVDLRFTG